MIAIPGIPQTNDEKLNAFIDEYIAKSIKAKLLDIITTYEDEEDHGYEMYEEDMLSYFFPDNFPSEDNEIMLKTMKALYSLIISDETWVPTLLMEYVLAQVIESGINNFEEIELESFRNNHLWLEDYEEQAEFEVNPAAVYRKFFYEHEFETFEKSIDETANIPFSKDTFTKLVDAYKQEGEAEGWLDEDDTEESKIAECEEIVDNIWHFSKKWLEWCFWDTDYMLLDMMEMGTLRHHYVNKVASILSEDAKDDEYYLPKDWKNSKDFKFLNCEDE